MRTDVCTLFEGDYHYGLAALINSLISSGYKGQIWAGYRGKLPAWAKASKEGNFQTLPAQDGLRINFIEIVPGWHLTHCKPDFMMEILNSQPEISTLFYFDPDICVHGEWPFFAQWASYGVALCADINPSMPESHPVRMMWRDWLSKNNVSVKRDSDTYFNGGFLSVRREDIGFLSKWREIMKHMQSDGIDLSRFGEGKRSNPFAKTDQDALNITVMTTDEPLSVIGHEGMDFVDGGYTMAHAAGVTKPWKKSFILEALRGIRPNRVDREYLIHANGAIAAHSPMTLTMKRINLAIAICIGRFIRR